MTPTDAGTPAGHRLADLLGATVVSAGGRELGHVNDVRLSVETGPDGPELVVDGLVVSGRHAGSMLGYDRRGDQGPWLLRTIVRRLHRGAGYLPWTAVGEVRWADRRVVARREDLQPLTGIPRS